MLMKIWEEISKKRDTRSKFVPKKISAIQNFAIIARGGSSGKLHETIKSTQI